MASGSPILLFLKKHRDRATLIGLLFGLAVFIGVGISLQKSSRDSPAESEPLPDLDKVELKLQNKDITAGQQHPQKNTAAFFLKPSPSELLEQLKELEDLNEDVVQARFSGLRVLWPVYFFSLNVTNEQGTVRKRLLADVSEDGFGVMVKTDLSLQDYPHLKELEQLEQGQKMWVGGEILAVDPEGTGVIYIQAEHITVGDQPAAVQDQAVEPPK